MFSVTLVSQCPSNSDTIFIEQLFSKSIVAKACLSVCIPEIQAILESIRKTNTNSNFVVTQRNGNPVSKSYIEGDEGMCKRSVWVSGG